MSTAQQLDDPDFGTWLRSLRKSQGLTLRKAAELIGDVSHVGIGYWERGVNLPEPYRLEVIAETYGVPVEAVRTRWWQKKVTDPPSGCSSCFLQTLRDLLRRNLSPALTVRRPLAA